MRLFLWLLLLPVPLTARGEGDTRVFAQWEQDVLSSSQPVRLGERAKFDLRVEYRVAPATFVSWRVDTDPQKNPRENESSKLESRLVHTTDSGLFRVGLDFDIRLDSGERGAIAIGPDTDSAKTYLAVQGEGMSLTFYPYNFGDETGQMFGSGKITTIHHIAGAPSVVTAEQTGGEEMITGTIPGLVFRLQRETWNLWLGAGAGHYQVPAGEEFDLATSTSAPRWHARRDPGWKAGLHVEPSPGLTVTLEGVGHDHSRETGSLLAAAGNLRTVFDDGQVRAEVELAHSRAGSRPWRLNERWDWFAQQVPFRPVYADVWGNRQRWAGRSGQAAGLRLGLHRGGMMPYLLLQQMSEYFVFRELESAHLLRTADESRSHGGLQIYGLGVRWQDGPLEVRPELQYRVAANKVFGHRRDVRSERLLMDLEKEETRLTMFVNWNH